MILVRFRKECPGLVGSLGRLYGEAVVTQVAADYCAAADLGGNAEVGLSREEGVSFNPRIARIVSLVIQDCNRVEPHMLRVAVYSTLPREKMGAVPPAVQPDVLSVGSASQESPGWMQGIVLALELDRIRHLHMIAMSDDERMSYMKEVQNSPLLSVPSVTHENLRLKVIHAIDLQTRRLTSNAER